MTIENTLERIAVALEKLVDFNSVSKTTDKPENKAPLTERTEILPKAADKPKKAATKKAEPEPEPEIEQEAPVESAGQEVPAVTYDEVRTAIMNLSAEKGRAVAVGVLGKFGAASGKDLKPAQYVEVLQAIDAEMLA